MKRMVIVAGFVAAMSCVASASAEPTPELRQRVQLMLRAPEHTPTAKEWKALGADAAVVLREVALNDKVLILRRGRAASALVHFDSSESRTALTQLVTNEKSAWLLRGKAARALVTLDGEKSLTVIQPLLAASHKRLREAAIKAIALVPAKASRDMLTARLPKEKNAHVRGVLERAVKDIDRRRAGR